MLTKLILKNCPENFFPEKYTGERTTGKNLLSISAIKIG
jgi:hypothetical protein